MELIPVWHQPDGMQLVLRTDRHVVVYDHNLRQVNLRRKRSIIHEPNLAVGHEPSNYQDSYACPLCLRPWAKSTETSSSAYDRKNWTRSDGDDGQVHVSPQYFRLLSQSSSAAVTENMQARADPSSPGYYEKFFIELGCLGRGAHGSVYMCQHVLHGHTLGKYAVKKIPIGDHNENLLRCLQEVHLMESLVHPNIINYKHAWVEMSQNSPFAPRVPTLHVLMMAANGGSLADWISARAGETNTHEGNDLQFTERIERLKSEFRRRRASAARREHPRASCMSIHFLREDEIIQLLRNITQGLEFLHEHNILHLDIKPGNVLLHWEDDALLPTAMISDFGSSLTVQQERMHHRTGNTGTMEYMAPEAVIARDGHLLDLTSKADIWSLGILLHLLIFFELPYTQVDDVDLLRQEIATYRALEETIETKGLGKRFSRVHPRLASLLTQMLHLDPTKRPSCRQILNVLDECQSQKEKDTMTGCYNQTSSYLQSSTSLIPREYFRVPTSPIPQHRYVSYYFDDRLVMAWSILMVYAQLVVLHNAPLLSAKHMAWLRHIFWLVLLVQFAYAYVEELMQCISTTFDYQWLGGSITRPYTQFSMSGSDLLDPLAVSDSVLRMPLGIQIVVRIIVTKRCGSCRGRRGSTALLLRAAVSINATFRKAEVAAHYTPALLHSRREHLIPTNVSI